LATNKKYGKSLFIFRRDLRIEDNTGLLNAFLLSEKVILCFIFDPRQVESDINEYKSNNAIQFMIESIYDLEEQILSEEKKKVDAVFVNKDYTPFSKKRDLAIKRVCKDYDVDFCQYKDYLLHEPDFVGDNRGRPITSFSEYFKKASSIPVKQIQNFRNYCSNEGLYNEPILLALRKEARQSLYERILDNETRNMYVRGGTRRNCQSILSHLTKLKDYEKYRNYPAKEEYSTTKLSAHIKFGTCSIREVYFAIKEQLGIEHQLIRQLYWREFFTYIAFHFPYVFGEAFNKKSELSKRWNIDGRKNNNDDMPFFRQWCEGKTGFPIVDAGMRELNKTGYMHNRLRMITASFLVNDLQIDWRLGEKYFAQKLVDYDPCINNGWWQWYAFVGCNRQHYLKPLNPWIQQKKIDPDCEYIKRQVSELESLSSDSIHNLGEQRPLDLVAEYPLPIIKC
jgi:deoxyribodipyrimidine photo-lyase